MAAADADHPLLVVRALGGFGKSALAWHWLLHDVDPRRWPRVVWWSFYEGDASFDRFLAETLAYLGVDPRYLGPRQQADELLRRCTSPARCWSWTALSARCAPTAAWTRPTRAMIAGRAEGGDRSGDTDCVSPVAEAFPGGVCLPAGHPGQGADDDPPAPTRSARSTASYCRAAARRN